MNRWAVTPAVAGLFRAVLGVPLSVDFGTTTLAQVGRSPLGVGECMAWVERGRCHPNRIGRRNSRGLSSYPGRSVGRSVGRFKVWAFIQKRQVQGKRQVQVQAEGNERDLARGICARARSPNAGMVCLPYNHGLVILFFSRPIDLHIHTMYLSSAPRLRESFDP